MACRLGNRFHKSRRDGLSTLARQTCVKLSLSGSPVLIVSFPNKMQCVIGVSVHSMTNATFSGRPDRCSHILGYSFIN